MTHSGAPYGISSSSLRGSGNGLSHPTDCARSPGLSPQWDQGCGQVSSRVRGRYVQRPADAAIGGARVVIELMVRRFRCETTRPAPLDQRRPARRSAGHPGIRPRAPV
ncbi:transposase family protein [Kitasatospora purpeofusca]|uniref:transposase family protein n=1 Tax=Kitasatospora purpeofusca TaxID=67352 RepID=UPI0035DDC313